MHGDRMRRVAMCRIRIKRKLVLINSLCGSGLGHLPWSGFWNSRNHYAREVPEGKQYKIMSKTLNIESKHIQILDSTNQGDIEKCIIINSIESFDETVKFVTEQKLVKSFVDV